MAPSLLSLADLKLTFGGDALLDGASLLVRPRDRIALVGRNGSGKSTLLKIAAGLIEPDGGERFVDPGATAGYLEQEPHLSGYETVEAYICAAQTELSDAAAPARLMEALKIDPDANPVTLSGGEARRAALARILAEAPDILLLDEPTNHLDLPAIEWLEDTINNLNAAVVVISHDRRFLKSVTTRTVWIDRGNTRNLDQGFEAFEEWRDKILEEEELERHKLDRKIVAEEHWVRYGVTARRKRNVRRLRELGELRRQRREERKTPGKVTFTTTAAAPSGKRVITAEKISKTYDNRKIVDDFSIEIARGDRIGFVGPNGAGKTTLINLLTGALPPDEGKIDFGTNLEIITLDQRRESLSEEMRVADAITDGRGDFVSIGESKKHVSTYLKDFLFAPEQWRAKIATLSGGERGRLALAAALAKPSNLLVLDEPTNDLDLETLELLEEMLAEYGGTLLLVSHDRSFLDRLVTSIVTVTPDEMPGRWIEYVGGYDDMISQRGETPGVALTSSPQPKKPAQSKGKAAPKTAGQKLSYKEKYTLEQLPKEMTALEEKITAAKNALADPNLFDTDPEKFAKLAAALEEAETRLAAAEEEWLELEMKRESLEGM